MPLKPAGEGTFELRLAKGEEALLYTGVKPTQWEVRPVDPDAASRNTWGLPAPGKRSQNQRRTSE